MYHVLSLRTLPKVALACVAAATFGPRAAHAQTDWIGDTSQNWNVAANWSSDPGDPTGAFLINTAAAGVFPVVSADSIFTPTDIFIASTAGSIGRLDQTGGALASGAGNWLRMGEGGGSTGTFNLSGGTYTGLVHMVRVGGVAGTATINVSGTGTLTSPGELVVSDGQNNTAAAQGTLNVGTGGTVNSEGDLIAAWAGNASAFGEINIAAGATINVASTVERWVIVNQWDTAQGRINVNGGTLNLNANTDLRFSPGNGVGTSAITLNSGAIVGGETSVIDLNRNGGAVNNTVNLNGGTLTIAKILTGSNNGTTVLNFNGGTLVASNNNSAVTNQDAVANFIEFGGASQRVNVRNGGAKINSNGFDITVSEALQHSNVGGDNAIDGGLTKSGAGTLSVTSTANTYTGPTSVTGGTLLMAGATATSGVTLSGGGFGNVSGASPVTVSSLTIGGPGSSLNVNLTSATPGLAITGALTTGGNSTTINATKGVWVNGANPLLSFGSLSGSLANFTVGSITGLNARQVPGALTNTGNGFSLTINGDNPKWTGASSGVWSTATIAAPKNWKLVIGGGNTDYLEGDAVEFDDTATGTTTIDITSPTGVAPISVAVNNSTKAYTFNGTGGSGITGTTSVVKSGTNSLTLNASNSHSGGTTVNGGTVNINNGSALGTGTFTIASGGTAKTLNNTSGFAVISTTNNVQTWNDNFTFTGSADGLSDLDMGTGAITAGGTGTDRTVTVSNGTLAVGELKAAAHGLVKQGAGTLAFTSTGPNVNGTNIAGTLNVAAGTVQMNRTSATGLDPFTGDLYVGGLAGSGAITNGAGETRWLFVNQAAATTSTFAGTLDNGIGGGALGFFKEGAGTVTLSGASTMTDRFTVADGTVAFAGGGSVSGASEYWIGNGAAVFKVDSSSRIGGFQLINITSNAAAPAAGAGSSGRLELSGNATLTNPITFAPRNDTNASDGIRNASGNNTLAGLITVVTGGNQARIRSDAGLLTLSGGLTTTATGGRFVYLQGAGNGVVSGTIADNSLDANGKINLIKQGAGTWTLSGFNTYTGNTVVGAGTLSITQADNIADTGDVSIFQGGTLNLANSGTTDTIDSLYLNGISVQPGLWGSLASTAPNKTALITGTGLLSVSTYDLPGDFDNNGIVNGEDLVTWRNGITGNNALGDTDGDTDTDGNDFLIWQRYLGTTLTTAAVSAVPEPTSLVAAGMAAIALAGFRRRCLA